MEIIDGIKFYNNGNYSEALTVLLSLPDGADKDDPFQIAYYLGLSYVRLKRYEDAIGYLEQVVTSDENIARVYQCRLILAYSYTMTGRSRLAEFELSKLISAGYESAQVYASMAFIAYEHEDVEKAIECYEKSLKIDPNNTTAQNGLGYIYADTDKDIKKALVFCKKANDLSPDNPVYMDSLAWVYHKMKFPNEAKKLITRVKEMLPENKLVLEHYREIIENED